MEPRYPGLPTRPTDQALELLAKTLETDLPENREFMNDVCDEQEKFGNNAEPIQPEDLDADEASLENHE